MNAELPSPDEPEVSRPRFEPRSRAARVLVLLALILLPQCVLFGPSLVGARILLPLDILEQPGVYIHTDPGTKVEPPVDLALSDLVFKVEPERRYAVESIRAGRIPLWNPLEYCGTPSLAANLGSVFDPLRAIDYLFPGPAAIAWRQLAKALLAGIGAYLFSRRVLRVSFLPAAFGAALWPNVGFLVLWAGFSVSQVGAHLPWMLLTADETLRKPRSRWPLALALATLVLLLSGHPRVAAEVLLAAGTYSLFRILDVHGFAQAFGKRGLAAAGALLLGCGIGILLSGPQTLPTLDYLGESYRVHERGAEHAETPVLGLRALPAVVMPYIDGSSQRHTVLTTHGNRLESTPAACVGMIALLVLAPIGFALRELRRFQVFWFALWLFGLGPLLGLPLVRELLQAPLLDTLPSGRLTLLSAWATVAMAVAGLEWLVRGEFAWRRAFALPMALLAGTVAYCVWRAASAPEVLQQASELLRTGAGHARPPLDTTEGIARVARWFEHVALGYAALATLCLVAWMLLRTRLARMHGAAFALALGLCALAEVTADGFDVNVQSRPELDYPPVPVLERLAQLPPGRICGCRGLPAALNLVRGLPDVRGFDAVDPARLVELLRLFPNADAPPPTEYAAVQTWFPSVPHGLLDLMGVRYLAVFGPPASTASYFDGSFWIRENPAALPRPFFARRAELVNDDRQRLERLAQPDFDPRAVVYLESDEPLPLDTQPVDASVQLLVDEPEYLRLALDVRSAGWLVLSDRWTKDWKARVDGVERPVLRADHAFRAVRVDPGAKVLEFRYEPAGWRRGWMAAGLGALLSLAWFLFARRTSAA
ncbi:MAG: hypothetical protein IPJ19_15690 [Planctomycetes bacterium]|nr:hypothetical protein [Planctomycetota bacterium]